jgi:hypothetical protein
MKHVVVTAADRASFTRCRRQWDLGGSTRQNLEPARPPGTGDLDRALRDALAVYYYPGMWDWEAGVRLPLVVQGLERALARQRERCGDHADAVWWQEQPDAGRDLLARYLAWAPAVDRFAPVLIEADYEVQVLDPVTPPAGLVGAAGEPIRYRGRIDLLAVDQHDAYWIVRHRVVDGAWPATEQLVQDEESLTACWAWEQFYLGMAITGTIYNELRRPARSGEPGPGEARPGEARPGGPRAGEQPGQSRRRWRRLRPWAGPARSAVRQHEPSGGGRSIPQHRRMYARAQEPGRPEPVEQHTGEGFRRTWLRRGPADVARAGGQLSIDVAQMTGPGPDVYPVPSGENCTPCPFRAPCQTLSAGGDTGPLLRNGYRRRPPDDLEEGRLGGGAWSTGRGAAPPKFRDP